jgi:hypothetical protein
MPKSKKPHYTRQSREPEEGEGATITFPSNLPYPGRIGWYRVFTRPSRAPSRGAMLFVYVIIALTCALVIVGCVMAAVGR